MLCLGTAERITVTVYPCVTHSNLRTLVVIIVVDLLHAAGSASLGTGMPLEVAGTRLLTKPLRDKRGWIWGAGHRVCGTSTLWEER